MKRIAIILISVLIWLISIAPTYASTQNALPVPLGFCVRASVPIGDLELVDSLFADSIWLSVTGYVIWIDGNAEGDIFELTFFVNTDTAFDMYSYDSSLPAYLSFNGLDAFSWTLNGARVEILDGQYCSIQAYKDNAALAQTYMVPNKGYDVYQIFPIDGKSQGLLSFTVTIDDLMNAKAGQVLGRNEAGNIFFTYLGGGKCSVTYPYPDGKTNSQSFTCWR